MNDEKALATNASGIRTWLAHPDRLAELKKALPKSMTPEGFTRAVATACLTNPRLMECSLESMWLAIAQSAQMGLLLDGRMAALVPYGKTAKMMPMYQGLIHVAYNHPRVALIDADIICEKDSYELRRGSRPEIAHTPASPPRGEPIAAYAVGHIQGSWFPAMVFMWAEEVEKHRAYSRGKDSIWVEHRDEMWKKTAIRMLAKKIPQSPQLMQALAVESDPELEGPAPTLPVPATAQVGEILDAIAGEKKAEDDAEK